MSYRGISQSATRLPMRAFRKVLNAAGRKLMGSIIRVKTQEPVVALTFDDGPHPVSTPQLLKLLVNYEAHATFFMLGAAAKKHPQLVEQVAKAGHTIGNHSYDHPSFPLITGRERRMQIRNCDSAISPYRSRLFRPPFGDLNLPSYFDATYLGYKVVAWDVVAEDWLNHSAERMANRMIEKAKPGSIILLHDALALSLEDRYCSRETMHEALDLFLTTLKSDYCFVSVNELLRYGPPVRKIWKQEPSPQLIDKLQLPNKQYF